jgi:hypothetical protein
LPSERVSEPNTPYTPFCSTAPRPKVTNSGSRKPARSVRAKSQRCSSQPSAAIAGSMASTAAHTGSRSVSTPNSTP